MTTAVDYKVHSCVAAPVTVSAKIGEREVQAAVDGLVVELVGNGCGHTFRLLPDSAEHLAEMRAMFTVGAGVRVTFAPAE